MLLIYSFINLFVAIVIYQDIKSSGVKSRSWQYQTMCLGKIHMPCTQDASTILSFSIASVTSVLDLIILARAG